MSAMFARYPAYQSSNDEWLGDIPVGWVIKPLRFAGRFQNGAGFPDDEQGLTGLELPFYKVRDLGGGAPGSCLAKPKTIFPEKRLSVSGPIYSLQTAFCSRRLGLPFCSLAFDELPGPPVSTTT